MSVEAKVVFESDEAILVHVKLSVVLLDDGLRVAERCSHKVVSAARSAAEAAGLWKPVRVSVRFHSAHNLNASDPLSSSLVGVYGHHSVILYK